jgi:heptosyltransferase-2
MPEYRNILVRGVNRLGDTVFSLPAIKALKQSYPGARVSVLTKPAPSGLYANLPYIDEVLIFESKGRHGGIRGRLALAGQLRKRRFDLAVVFHNCFDAALVPFLAGVPERIGYLREMRGVLLTKKLPFPATPVHQVDHYLELAALAGASTEERTPELFVTPEEEQWGRRLLDGRNARRPLVGIVPGSVALTRRWPPERFAELGDRLAQATGGSIIILGGPGDGDISGKIKSHMKAGPIDTTGGTGLRQLMALISLCDLVVSNDTGPMHITWALGRPVVTFIGAADIREIRPLSTVAHIIGKDLACSPCIKEECPEGTTRCLDLITVGEVFEKSMEILHKT